MKTHYLLFHCCCSVWMILQQECSVVSLKMKSKNATVLLFNLLLHTHSVVLSECRPRALAGVRPVCLPLGGGQTLELLGRLPDTVCAQCRLQGESPPAAPLTPWARPSGALSFLTKVPSLNQPLHLWTIWLLHRILKDGTLQWLGFGKMSVSLSLFICKMAVALAYHTT